MTPDRMEHVGALLLAGLLILGAEVAVILWAFDARQVQTVLLGSMVASIGMATTINLQPIDRRGRLGSRVAGFGGALMIGVAAGLPFLGTPAYLAQVVGALFIAAMWLLPQMAAQQLLAGALRRLKAVWMA